MTCKPRPHRTRGRTALAVGLVWNVALLLAAAQIAIPTGGRRVVPGDRIRIDVAEEEDLSEIYAVAGDGTIDFGFAGRINVSEKTLDEVADQLEDLLEASYFKEATVFVGISEFKGNITVLGEVLRPQQIPFQGGQMMTLIEAIAICGGFTERAAGAEVRILRWGTDGGMQRQVLNVDALVMFRDLDFSLDQFLRPRDIIMVPRIGGLAGGGEGYSEFLILGEMDGEGFQQWFEGMNVIRAITLAGGIPRTAQLDSVRILREQENGTYEAIHVDVAALFGVPDLSLNYDILPGDILFVPSVDQARSGTAYLLGEAGKTGAIPLPMRGGASLAKTLLANGGIGQFGNGKKVKIIRRAPDGTKLEMTVDVETILETGAFEDDVPIFHDDVIIIPGKILSI